MYIVFVELSVETGVNEVLPLQRGDWLRFWRPKSVPAPKE